MLHFSLYRFSQRGDQNGKTTNNTITINELKDNKEFGNV